MDTIIQVNLMEDISHNGNGVGGGEHSDIFGTMLLKEESTSSGRSSPNAGSGSYDSKLFVGGLSWMTTPEKLKEYFTQFGTVTDVLVMKDPITQRSRGFGFITFSDPTTVSRVLAIPIHNLDGKRIDPKHATPKSKGGSSKTKKVFVGGVSQDTSVEELKAYFSNFGKVDEAVMLMDQQTKRHRGFGFVTFEAEDVVDRICKIHFHTIKGKKVECKKAQPKETVANINVLAKRMVLPISTTLAAQVASLGGMTMSPVAAAVANYSKFVGNNSLTTHPALSSFRYSPYQIPTITPAGATHGLTNLSNSPYGPFGLPGLDVTNFQNIDWSGLYNAFA